MGIKLLYYAIHKYYDGFQKGNISIQADFHNEFLYHSISLVVSTYIDIVSSVFKATTIQTYTFIHIDIITHHHYNTNTIKDMDFPRIVFST